ncbi:uncharacterized protein MONBRDRAFT_26605 [Monosiga brevicollis MX1]|uniref:Uncharacterized protein n=1 Tax=Monosiga brevicollis TaxID=81824 RepID=A9V2U8_MONBE|nr:uncharacterized protein MONBRDRAFT_26605 [Monosiga brevicollis MX1]EDQ88075.1 predicted protein [Monosiga brevicollis MX1]|eukprot:XP_001747151.1 hypothetical protein [Monosiga brevicollis MX1]
MRLLWTATLDALQLCHDLQVLLASHNTLIRLPTFRLQALWHIDLSNNQLAEVDALVAYSCLGFVNLANNMLDWHGIARLQEVNIAWLVLAGNPVEVDPHFGHAIAQHAVTTQPTSSGHGTRRALAPRGSSSEKKSSPPSANLAEAILAMPSMRRNVVYMLIAATLFYDIPSDLMREAVAVHEELDGFVWQAFQIGPEGRAQLACMLASKLELELEERGETQEDLPRELQQDLARMMMHALRCVYGVDGDAGSRLSARQVRSSRVYSNPTHAAYSKAMDSNLLAVEFARLLVVLPRAIPYLLNGSSRGLTQLLADATLDETTAARIRSQLQVALQEEAWDRDDSNGTADGESAEEQPDEPYGLDEDIEEEGQFITDGDVASEVETDMEPSPEVRLILDSCLPG